MLTTETRLGPYEIVSHVGSGGMGEVYKARNTRLERTVAIKVLAAHHWENPTVKKRFEREARAIQHYHIPTSVLCMTSVKSSITLCN